MTQTPMTSAEAIKRLRSAAEECPDEEAAHMRADDVLCDLLDSLGYQDVTAEFKKMEKWYS